jgi:SAM-dependent methyltransferase
VNLKETQANWTALGEDDPMWVVLTDPEKKGHRWTPEDFFATGLREIEGLFAQLQKAGLNPPASGRALDFGCGLGRLSQALATRFATVDGVDISSSMIRQADTFNRFPDRVKYHVNPHDNLALFATGQYDFICSLIALQHIPPAFQQSYLRDFLRVLKPGGIACFQTIEAHGWRRLIPHWAADWLRRRRSGGKPFIPLYGLAAARVREIIQHSGGNIIKHDNSGYGGWESRYHTDFFIVNKMD